MIGAKFSSQCTAPLTAHISANLKTATLQVQPLLERWGETLLLRTQTLLGGCLDGTITRRDRRSMVIPIGGPTTTVKGTPGRSRSVPMAQFMRRILVSMAPGSRQRAAGATSRPNALTLRDTRHRQTWFTRTELT